MSSRRRWHNVKFTDTEAELLVLSTLYIGETYPMLDRRIARRIARRFGCRFSVRRKGWLVYPPRRVCCLFRKSEDWRQEKAA